MYMMKGLGDRPLLYATIITYHEAELRLTEALRLPHIARNVGLARELGAVSGLHIRLRMRVLALTADDRTGITDACCCEQTI